MLNDQKPKFLEIMTGLSEIYDKRLSSIALEFYWAALKDFSFEEFEKAATNIVRTHKYATMPKPAEFIEYINPPEDADARAELALEEFFERFRDSAYESFEWRDPVLAMTIEHYGGWGAVLSIYPHDLEQEKFWLIDFKKTYKIFLKYPRPVKLRVVGVIENHNRSRGYLTAPDGNPIPLPDGEGFIKIGSPEAQKYLGAKEQKLIE